MHRAIDPDLPNDLVGVETTAVDRNTERPLDTVPIRRIVERVHRNDLPIAHMDNYRLLRTRESHQDTASSVVPRLPARTRSMSAW